MTYYYDESDTISDIDAEALEYREEHDPEKI